MNHKLKNERFRRRLVSILSCIVVFCTTYALILPAVTLERDDIVYYCGKEEHQHTDECYESSKDRPLCGLKDGEMVDGHVHDESCYKTEMVLDCLEDHEHTDACYKEEKTLVCDKEEGAQEHKHSSKCFLSTEPLCGKEVHTHSRECESNKSLKETKEDWEHSIPAKLKDTAAERMVQIALSQKDYKEVKENFELNEEGHEQYYTRYGEWYGRPYEDWNVMFVSFVLRYAEIKNEQIPYGHDWNEWIEDLTKKQLFADEGYLPKDGDLIFIKDKEDENVPDKEIRNYAGIVTDIENRKIVVGDLNGQVKEITLDDKEYETNAYVAMIESDAKDDVPADKEENDDNETNEEERPDEETGKEEANEEETDPIEFRMPEQFEIENEDFTLTLTPRVFDEDVQEDNEEQTEENSEETNEEGLKIKKFSLNEENIQDKIDEQAQTSEEEQAEIEQLKQQSLENVDQDNLLDLSFYKLRFFADGQEVDLKDQKFDAELTPTQKFVDECDVKEEFPDAAPEAEVGYYLQVVQPGAQVPSSLIDNTEEQSVNNEENLVNNKPVLEAELLQTTTHEDDSILINDSYNGESIKTVFKANQKFAKLQSRTSNPSFTVQTYGYIEENKEFPDLQDSNSQIIRVINMTNPLPTTYDHNSPNRKKYKVGNNGKLLKEERLLPLYTENTYQYHNAPNLRYFNKLKDNPHYVLKEVWIKKDSNTSNTDIDKDKWIIKECASNDNHVYFTNRPETAEKNPKYILINDKDVIRLVYKPSDASFSSNVTFFDYDITESGFTDTYQGNPLAVTNKNKSPQGINHPSNYTMGSGEQLLAFGNANTKTGMANPNEGGRNFTPKYTINGYDINRGNYVPGVNAANNAGINHPVFGIVNGYNKETDTLIYNSAIKAPDLFSNKSFNGKTVYSGDNYNLNFKRYGDSYTLTGVSGLKKATSGLDQFVHPQTDTNTPYQHILTNNFWPLDDDTNRDGKTGGKSTKTAKGIDKNGKEAYENFPRSDDGKEHNNLFGMKYQINFTLDSDYIGPLEYFFFGDDDLWVFLDNQLICDLGGVHSSYGGKVDLWNFIDKDNRTESKEYTLTIFYTERGLSGSTCYMEFLLPLVSEANPGHETGNLKIEKNTLDDDTNKDFSFKVNFYEKDGITPLQDDYKYTIYDQNNSESSSGVVEWDKISDGETFKLKKNQYAIIEYLPLGTPYTISEINVEKGTVVHINGEVALDYSISGKIPDKGPGTIEEYIKFLNIRSYQLPETGSLGIDPSLIAGSAGLMTTSFYALTLKRKGRWRKRKR